MGCNHIIPFMLPSISSASLQPSPLLPPFQPHGLQPGGPSHPIPAVPGALCPIYQRSPTPYGQPQYSREPLSPSPGGKHYHGHVLCRGAGDWLHDGAGEATALLEQREACLGHIWGGGLLPSGSHFLLFDRSYGERHCYL